MIAILSYQTLLSLFIFFKNFCLFFFFLHGIIFIKAQVVNHLIIGKYIKTARIKAGLTQVELAQKLGIPYQSIGQWERGKRKP